MFVAHFFILPAISGQAAVRRVIQSPGFSACGQMVSTMTEICSPRDVSPVSLATRASITAMHSSQVGAAETEKEEKARVATNVAADNFMVEVDKVVLGKKLVVVAPDKKSPH